MVESGWEKPVAPFTGPAMNEKKKNQDKIANQSMQVCQNNEAIAKKEFHFTK